MYDRENDNRNNNEGRQVQQELEDQLRAFGDTMTDAFAVSYTHLTLPTKLEV